MKQPKEVRLAVVGSRGFPYKWLVMEYLRTKRMDEIVSGGAAGVDSWAEQHAFAYGLPCRIFPADWNEHGRGAGFIRNKEIVDYATDVVAFHYGDSKGTAHTIKLASKAGKLREVIHVS